MCLYNSIMWYFGFINVGFLSSAESLNSWECDFMLNDVQYIGGWEGISLAAL